MDEWLTTVAMHLGAECRDEMFLLNLKLILFKWYYRLQYMFLIVTIISHKSQITLKTKQINYLKKICIVIQYDYIIYDTFNFTIFLKY